MSASVLISNHAAFKQLMQLKEQYAALQQDLKKVQNETAEDAIFVRPRLKLHYTHFHKTSDNLDRGLLHALMKQVIEKHGGACHTDTLVDYIRKYWPKAVRLDGSPFTIHDYKVNAKRVLKDKNSGFIKDSISGWTMLPEQLEIDNITETTPLSDKIAQVIEDSENCACNSQTIYQQVKEQWIKPVCKGTVESDEQIKEHVSITLETSPRFQYDSKNPDNYSVTPSKKRSKNSTLVRKRKRGEDSSDSEREAPSEPPPGFRCSCGATTPGKTITAKWRIDAAGVFKCISCYGKNKRYSAKNAKKKKKSSSHYESEPGPWIQCDKCHAWIPAFSDNIHDISLYDDSNPNHLDYFCPDCRKTQPNEPQRKSSRRKAGRTRVRE